MQAPCLEAAFCQSQECMAAMMGIAGIVLQGQLAQLQAWVSLALAILDRALSTCLCPLSLHIHRMLSDRAIWSAFVSVLAAWCQRFCGGRQTILPGACFQACQRACIYKSTSQANFWRFECICRTSSNYDVFEIGGSQFKL